MRYTGKPLAKKALKMLDNSLGSFVDSAWERKHREWVTQELRDLAARHGLDLGGEGVREGGAVAPGNQSAPQAKNSQCASTVTHPVSAERVPYTTVTGMTESEPESATVGIAVLDAAQLPRLPDWPAEAKLRVIGYCNNPKLMACALEEADGKCDGTKRVSMYRGVRPWRVGQSVPARLTQGGGSPIYTAV